MKPNYVIYATPEDYYKLMYKDIIEKPNVLYLSSSPIDNRYNIYGFLYRIIRRINKKYLRLGLFQKIPVPRLNPDTPIYFVFFYGRLYWVNDGLIDFLKNKYPKSRCICYFQDLISIREYIDIENVKKNFDLVISYDAHEAQMYQIEYYPTPFSYIDVKQNPQYDTDVYFLGRSKGRFDLILQIYDNLVRLGYRCDFYISDVQTEQRVKRTGIHYIDSMTYIENLEHVVSCRILLEIIQDKSVGCTLRTWEAIVYKKKLLTNNKYLQETPYYSSYVTIINGTSFDVEHLKRTDLDYPNDKKLSPSHLLDFIRIKLS